MHTNNDLVLAGPGDVIRIVPHVCILMPDLCKIRLDWRGVSDFTSYEAKT